MTIPEYDRIADEIIEKNDYQRKEVRLKYRIYSLLKQDLINGCLMPPIILATTESFGEEIRNELVDILGYDELLDSDIDRISNYAKLALEKKELLILDGLQRTITINDVLKESKGKWWLESLQKQKIRIEMYLGLNKQGILYRMLTLNTGQTPMTFRHQLEILYHDHLLMKFNQNINILREIDEGRITQLGTYKFNNVIELYHSFLSGNPKPVDKQDLMEEIQSLDFLENFESKSNERMARLLEVYHFVVRQIEKENPKWKYSGEKQISNPFGKSLVAIFSKSQSMTGFGSTASSLIDEKVFSTLDSIDQFIRRKFKPSVKQIQVGINYLIEVLEDIRQNTKRYGDAQRGFFALLFRNILLSSKPSNLREVTDSAYQSYRIKYG